MPRFAAIQVPVYTFPHPVGTAIPRPVAYRLASLVSYAPEVARSIATTYEFGAHDGDGDHAYPQVNRRHKGNRLSPPKAATRPSVRPKTEADWAALTTAPEGLIVIAPDPAPPPAALAAGVMQKPELFAKLDGEEAWAALTTAPEGMIERPSVQAVAAQSSAERVPSPTLPDSDAAWAALTTAPEGLIERPSVHAVAAQSSAEPMPSLPLPDNDAAWAQLTTAPEGKLSLSLAMPPLIEAARPPEDGVWPPPPLARLADVSAAVSNRRPVFRRQIRSMRR